MFKENPFATVLFIIILIGLIGLLAYTPFYLKEYKADLNEKHEIEKNREKEEIERNNQAELDKLKEKEDEEKNNEENDKNKDEEKDENMNLKLIIEVNKVKYTAKLEDNKTTREFIKKLPLEITMTDLNNNEKYYRFNEKFTSNPVSVNKINKGDLMLYEDNTLVLFYDSFDTIYKYTKIGNISETSKLMTNLGKGNVKVKFYQEKEK